MKQMKMKDLVLEHYRKVYETEMDGLTVRVWKPKTMEQLPAYRMKHVIDHYADEARNSWRFSESRKVQWLGGNPDHGAWDAQIVRRFDPRKQSLDIYFAALLIRPFSKQAFDYYGERMSLDPQMRLVLMWDSRVYDKWHGYDTIGVTGRKKSKAPCMVLFCAFEQLHYYIDLGKRYGFMHYIPLVFRKNYSAQVLKANMKIVGNCEYGLVLYKDKLPKFNNDGRMVFNCFEWPRDTQTPKVHPTQKPVALLEELIRIFTDKNDVIIDPCAGSATTLRAAMQTGRRAYGFEIKKDFYKLANEKILTHYEPCLF